MVAGRSQLGVRKAPQGARPSWGLGATITRHTAAKLLLNLLCVLCVLRGGRMCECLALSWPLPGAVSWWLMSLGLNILGHHAALNPWMLYMFTNEKT